jgi:hypothetical protein
VLIANLAISIFQSGDAVLGSPNDILYNQLWRISLFVGALR